ncbi:MAG: GNAT family N-acetyltransferase [Christensenellales bacterium]
MTDYRPALPQEEDDILDLANYVFSLGSRPHDFARLQPRVYARPGSHRYHLVASRGGRLKAMVATLPLRLWLAGDSSLLIGFVGTVCVHPYARGEGHMKALMPMTRDRALAGGMEMLVLGGQRQRYNYFGYERAGSAITFSLNATNLRHRLGGEAGDPYTFVPLEGLPPEELSFIQQLHQRQGLIVQRPPEDFVLTLRTWEGAGYGIRQKDRLIGYLYARGEEITEWALEPADALLPLMQAWLLHKHLDEVRLTLSLHRREDIAILSEAAESYNVGDTCMIQVLDWRAVLQKLLDFKADHCPLEDGEAVLEITGAGRFLIAVEGGRPLIAPSAAPADLTLDHNAAVLRLFSLQSGFAHAGGPFRNWLPLYFLVPEADSF